MVSLAELISSTTEIRLFPNGNKIETINRKQKTVRNVRLFKAVDYNYRAVNGYGA